MPPRVTLKDVAEHVGVSYQTVWRVMHGKPGVRPETHGRVASAAEQLGFRINKVAGGLRTSRTATVGLVVPDVSNAYTGKFARGVESAAQDAGFSVLLSNTDNDPVRERAAMVALLERRIDGVIVHAAAGTDPACLGAIIPAGLPVVSMNRPAALNDTSVMISYRHGDTAKVVDHLQRRGIERIGAVFASLESPMFRGRHDGLREAMRARGLPVDERWWRVGRETVEDGRELTASILREPDRPDAVFTSAYRLTEGALLGLKDLGMRHGTDVELVGFDLGYAALLDPPVPFVEQPSERTGHLACTTLLRMISGDPDVPAEQLIDLAFHDHGR